MSLAQVRQQFIGRGTASHGAIRSIPRCTSAIRTASHNEASNFSGFMLHAMQHAGNLIGPEHSWTLCSIKTQ